jgi:hypothetical protein
LHDPKVVPDNNNTDIVNKIVARLEKLEGKRMVMLIYRFKNLLLSNLSMALSCDYYGKQGLYTATNKAKLASSIFETRKANLGVAIAHLCQPLLLLIWVKIHGPILEEQQNQA